MQRRRSHLEKKKLGGFGSFKNDNDDNGGENHPLDFDQLENDLLNSMCNMDTKVKFHHEEVCIYELYFMLYTLSIIKHMLYTMCCM